MGRRSRNLKTVANFSVLAINSPHQSSSTSCGSSDSFSDGHSSIHKRTRVPSVSAKSVQSSVTKNKPTTTYLVASITKHIKMLESKLEKLVANDGSGKGSVSSTTRGISPVTPTEAESTVHKCSRSKKADKKPRSLNRKASRSNSFAKTPGINNMTPNNDELSKHQRSNFSGTVKSRLSGSVRNMKKTKKPTQQTYNIRERDSQLFGKSSNNSQSDFKSHQLPSTSTACRRLKASSNSFPNSLPNLSVNPPVVEPGYSSNPGRLASYRSFSSGTRNFSGTQSTVSLSAFDSKKMNNVQKTVSGEPYNCKFAKNTLTSVDRPVASSREYHLEGRVRDDCADAGFDSDSGENIIYEMNRICDPELPCRGWFSEAGHIVGPLVYFPQIKNLPTGIAISNNNSMSDKHNGKSKCIGNNSQHKFDLTDSESENCPTKKQQFNSVKHGYTSDCQQNQRNKLSHGVASDSELVFKRKRNIQKNFQNITARSSTDSESITSVLNGLFSSGVDNLTPSQASNPDFCVDFSDSEYRKNSSGSGTSYGSISSTCGCYYVNEPSSSHRGRVISNSFHDDHSNESRHSSHSHKNEFNNDSKKNVKHSKNKQKFNFSKTRRSHTTEQLSPCSSLSELSDEGRKCPKGLGYRLLDTENSSDHKYSNSLKHRRRHRKVLDDPQKAV